MRGECCPHEVMAASRGPKRFLFGYRLCCHVTPNAESPAAASGLRNASRTHSRAVSQPEQRAGRLSGAVGGERAGGQTLHAERGNGGLNRPLGVVLQGPAVSRVQRKHIHQEGKALAQGHSGTPHTAVLVGKMNSVAEQYFPAREGCCSEAVSRRGWCTSHWGQINLVPDLAWLCLNPAVGPGQPLTCLSLSFPIWKGGQ